MILLIEFALFGLCLYLRFIRKLEFEKHGNPTFGFLFAGVAISCFISVNVLVMDIWEVNKLKAQNIHMLPLDVQQENVEFKKTELNEIKEQIKTAVNKNKFQVQVQNLNRISIYAMPMSANGTSFQGLGDIERGGAEKLKLLENLIEKQKEIANELIQAQRELSREDYYKRNAEIMVYENSIFDGVLVRWLSIRSNQNLNLIKNRVYYPDEK